jgi:hypothetical protein
MQPNRPALRLLSGPAACMGASWCIYMAWGTVPPRVSVVVLAPWDMAHTPVGAGGRSCEAETCRVRRRLIGGIPLVGNWSETWRLASVGLDWGPQSSSSWILALALSILAFTLSTVLGYLMFKGDLFAIKGGPNLGPRHLSSNSRSAPGRVCCVCVINFLPFPIKFLLFNNISFFRK